MSPAPNIHPITWADGRSLVPLLQNEDPVWPARTLGWHYPHKWGPEGPGCDPFTSVRVGDWKLIYFYKDERFELYDLVNDLGETSDLAWKEPERLESMKAAMAAWMNEMGAQTPENRKTGQSLPVPGS